MPGCAKGANRHAMAAVGRLDYDAGKSMTMTHLKGRSVALVFAAAMALGAGCGRTPITPPDFDLDDGGLPKAGKGGAGKAGSW